MSVTYLHVFKLYSKLVITLPLKHTKINVSAAAQRSFTLFCVHCFVEVGMFFPTAEFHKDCLFCCLSINVSESSSKHNLTHFTIFRATQFALLASQEWSKFTFHKNGYFRGSGSLW